MFYISSFSRCCVFVLLPIQFKCSASIGITTIAAPMGMTSLWRSTGRLIIEISRNQHSNRIKMNKFQQEQQTACNELLTNSENFITLKWWLIFFCLNVKYRKRNVSQREKERKEGCERNDDYFAAPKYINQTIYNKNERHTRYTHQFSVPVCKAKNEKRERESERERKRVTSTYMQKYITVF